MPIMAAHNDQSSNYSSPINSTIFYDNSNAYSSPDSPTLSNSRKRKQQQHDWNYYDINQQSSNNDVLNDIYSSTYHQSENSTSNSNHHQQQEEFIVPINSSSSTSTAFGQPDNLMQRSSVINNNWHRTVNNDSNAAGNSFLVSNNTYDDSFMSHNQKTVGENTNEIHQILNLDEPISFVNTAKDTRNIAGLNLNDSRLMHQTWSPQPQQQSFNTGASSPGFFTPGFLESLQEDENESPQSFPFHVTTKNWNLEREEISTMEHDTIMVMYMTSHIQ